MMMLMFIPLLYVLAIGTLFYFAWRCVNAFESIAKSPEKLAEKQ